MRQHRLSYLTQFSILGARKGDAANWGWPVLVTPTNRSKTQPPPTPEGLETDIGTEAFAIVLNEEDLLLLRRQKTYAGHGISRVTLSLLKERIAMESLGNWRFEVDK